MPIKITSQSLHERFRDGQEPVGKPMAICAPVNQSVAETGIAYTVPDDKVLLLTHVLAQVDDGFLLTGQAPASPPAPYANGLEIKNGATVHHNMSFLAFRRWLSVFDQSATATEGWVNARPGNIVTWKPKYPIAVGPGLDIGAIALFGEFGYTTGAYGYLVDRDQAGVLGFPVENSDTASDRRYSVVSDAGSAASGTSDTMIAGRNGRSIRILDMVVRIQPTTNTLLEVELSQDDGTTERVFWKFATANVGELVEMKFSPDIYLKSGASLKIKTTRDNECSITIAAEYVDDRHIPRDHWWAMVEPTLPDSSSFANPYGNAVVPSSTQVVPYFPARDTTSVSVTDQQWLINGYSFYVQQSAVASTDKLGFMLHAGETAGIVQGAGVGIPVDTTHQVCPMFQASTHDQLAYAVVDDISVPVGGDFGSPSATKSSGSIWVDAIGLDDGPAAPPGFPMSTDAWGVCAWGRLVNAVDRYTENKGA